jgi:hypothetical protein
LFAANPVNECYGDIATIDQNENCSGPFGLSIVGHHDWWLANDFNLIERIENYARSTPFQAGLSF